MIRTKISDILIPIPDFLKKGFFFDFLMCFTSFIYLFFFYCTMVLWVFHTPDAGLKHQFSMISERNSPLSENETTKKSYAQLLSKCPSKESLSFSEEKHLN